MSGRYDLLPEAFARAWPGLIHVKRVGREWRSECPRCGKGQNAGHFIMRRDDAPTYDPFRKRETYRERGWCRACGYFAWADEGEARLITPEEIAAMRAKHVEIERVRAEERARRIEDFSDEEFFAEYARRMGEKERAQWAAWGVPPEWQAWYRLGYTPAYRGLHDGQEFLSPAYTIPVFPPGSDMDAPRPVNIQYRLENPPAGAGKYRQHVGLPAAAFYARPDQNPLGEKGRVLLVEGAKKAAVSYIYAGFELDLQVIGLPGARSWAGIVDVVREAEIVYVALDPDAQGPAADLAKACGKPARIVDLPEKPDDMLLTVYGERDATGDAAKLLNRYLKLARVP